MRRLGQVSATEFLYRANVLCRDGIPKQWGMRQLNLVKGYVLTIPNPDEFTVNIDTSNFDAFTIPTTPDFVVIDDATVVGIGDANYGQSSPGGVVPLPQTIPGAYQNHRPS